MNIKSIILLTALCILSKFSYSQCKNTCLVTMTNAKTKEALKGNYLVEVKTGWEVWVKTGQASYKTKANETYIFALVYRPKDTIILKAFKGIGPDLVWSGASPSVNCDVFPWGSFAVTDASGNKGTIKLASY